MTPEYAVVNVAQQLTDFLKGKLPETMGKITIGQLKKMDSIFNMTADDFRQ